MLSQEREVLKENIVEKTVELEKVVVEKEQQMVFYDAMVVQIKEEKAKEINNNQEKFEETLLNQKVEYEDKVQKMKSDHQDDIKKNKEIADQKVTELRGALQKLQEMLPEKSEREGYLIKQGGGHKSWKKRYFVLKTNFMCYYKDAKSLIHPCGVIDLADCNVKATNFEVLKKKYCFEIATPLRTYYVQGKNDEEIAEWVKAVESSKAKYRKDLNNRKTFFDLKSENDDNK